MRLGGRDRPIAVSAARTRSRASPTALSGRPTIRKAGSPLLICTWTSTGTASMPEKAKLRMRARLMQRGAQDVGATVRQMRRVTSPLP
jgi:hypothetical protein